MPERMRRILEGLSTALRFDYDFDYHWSYPPTVNAREMNDVVREAGRRELGADNVVEHDIVMWAEDMSFMQEARPGAYFIVGARGGLETVVSAPQRALRHRRARARRRLPHDGRSRPGGLRQSLLSKFSSAAPNCSQPASVLSV